MTRYLTVLFLLLPLAVNAGNWDDILCKPTTCNPQPALEDRPVRDVSYEHIPVVQPRLKWELVTPQPVSTPHQWLFVPRIYDH